MEDVCAFLHTDLKNALKAVVYQENLTDKYNVVFIRGDLEVNETKLRNFVGCEIHPADITEDSGIVKGFIGPVNFKGNARVLFDKSLDGTDNLVCGANEEGYHYTGLNLERDVKVESFCDVAKPLRVVSAPCAASTASTSAAASRWAISSSWEPSILMPWVCSSRTRTAAWKT